MKVGVDGDTAGENTDYAHVADFDITIGTGAGSATNTFSLDPTDDTLDEDVETLTVTGASGDIAITDASITITDDDDMPVVSVTDATAVNEGNDSETTVDMEFTVTMDAVSGRAVTVPYTLGGTASAPSDYTEPNPLSVTIVAGARSANLVIPVKGDTVDEPDETVIVTLGTPTNATVSTAEGAGTATGTIRDDDTLSPQVTATIILGEDTNTKVAENVQTAPTITVTASLSGKVTSSTDQTVTVTVGDDDDSATKVDDYQAVEQFDITILAESSSGSGSFTFTPVDDAIDEEDETVSIMGGFSGKDPVALGSITITDDDDRGVTIVGGPLSMDEVDNTGTSGSKENEGSYTVVLDSEPTDDVRIDLTAPSMVTLSPASLTFTSSNWNQAQTVTVTAVNDDTDNAGDVRTGHITHAVVAGSSDYTGVNAANVSVTVNDDDATSTVTLALSPATIDEDGGVTSGRSTVTATLSHPSSQAGDADGSRYCGISCGCG